MTIRCLTVDDEPLALKVLENYIGRVEILVPVAFCRSAIEALNIMQKEKVDLLFLDIEMPKMSGMAFLKSLPTPPLTVFTTAYREYAVESYEYNALDYLVKPIGFDRFMQTVNKAYDAIYSPTLPVPEPDKADEKFITLKSGKKTYRISLEKVQYVESFKDYVVVHTATENITCYQHISHIEQALPQDRFLRIHRSFIVPIDKIYAFNATSVTIADTDLPIGRTFKDQVMKALER